MCACCNSYDYMSCCFFFSSRRRDTRCALVTGVQTCAIPIYAVFGLPEVKRGMYAFAGGGQRLARLVPRSTAMTVILTGDPLPAARLHELGVISALVGLDQLMPTVRKVAPTINANRRPAIDRKSVV